MLGRKLNKKLVDIRAYYGSKVKNKNKIFSGNQWYPINIMNVKVFEE